MRRPSLRAYARLENLRTTKEALSKGLAIAYLWVKESVEGGFYD
jgi:hypothetical protein